MIAGESLTQSVRAALPGSGFRMPLLNGQAEDDEVSIFFRSLQKCNLASLKALPRSGTY